MHVLQSLVRQLPDAVTLRVMANLPEGGKIGLGDLVAMAVERLGIKRYTAAGGQCAGCTQRRAWLNRIQISL